MVAIATEYRGIVFRSQFEALCYDYLTNVFKEGFSQFNYIIEYEPENFLKNGWLPDFSIKDLNNNPVALIEAKPSNEFFKIRKYIHCLEWCDLICMDNEKMIIFKKEGGIYTYNHNELLWKQAFNNVKAYK